MSRFFSWFDPVNVFQVRLLKENHLQLLNLLGEVISHDVSFLYLHYASSIWLKLASDDLQKFKFAYFQLKSNFHPSLMSLILKQVLKISLTNSNFLLLYLQSMYSLKHVLLNHLLIISSSRFHHFSTFPDFKLFLLTSLPLHLSSTLQIICFQVGFSYWHKFVKSLILNEILQFLKVNFDIMRHFLCFEYF